MTTLGDVLTFILIGAALIVVPYKLAKAWVWPLVRPLLMSRWEHWWARTTYKPPEPVVGLRDTYQTQLEEPDQNEPMIESFRLRQLPRADLIVLLAVQRKEEGGYLFSANEITSFVRGTAAPVKALIADVRAEKQAEPLPPGRIERPNNGWPKRA